MTDHRSVVGRRRVLPRRFYAREATAVAPDLLGKLLVADKGGMVIARIVETEAYRQDDPASHAYRGRTPRVASMFGPVGHAYVYFTYGMHWCLNVSCEGDGVGAAVLLRSAAVVDGVDLVRRRRGHRRRERDLLRGPARLTQGLGVDGGWDGVDLTDPEGRLRVEADDWEPAPSAVTRGPRVGIRNAAEVHWRWWIEGLPEVSRYTRHPGARQR